jgi:hydroxymethylglutaryl-CoA synthase
MHKEKKVGISDIAMYIPTLNIDLEKIIAERIKSNPRLSRHFERAVRVTGQRMLRFPAPWEDTVTMSAEAVHRLLSRTENADWDRIRYLTVGTETGVDHSKPVSAYIQGVLQRSGFQLPVNLSSFQVQHACAGGSLAMLAVAALIKSANSTGDTGITVCSDIARYQTHSTAELTQGSGAVAFLIEQDPELLELDLETVGYASRDVDDFFRPIGSRIAVVKGQYSIKCYLESLNDAFEDHCRRKGSSAEKVLQNTDLFALHTPFKNMPETAMHHLFSRHLGFTETESADFLEKRSFYRGIEPIADIGNMYAASVYAVLAYQLRAEYEKKGKDIAGERVLLASYGSGNTMALIEGTVSEKAADIIASWKLGDLYKSLPAPDFTAYEKWARGSEALQGDHGDAYMKEIPEASYFLKGVREDGYREYQYKSRVADGKKKKTASRDMHQSVSIYR